MLSALYKVGDGQRAVCARFNHGLDHPRHTADLVTGALQIHNHPRNTDQQTQVTRGRLTSAHDGCDVAVDLHFHAIDVMFNRKDLFSLCDRQLMNGLDGVSNLHFDQSTHFQNPCGDAVQFCVVLTRQMFLIHEETLKELDKRSHRD